MVTFRRFTPDLDYLETEGADMDITPEMLWEQQTIELIRIFGTGLAASTNPSVRTTQMWRSVASDGSAAAGAGELAGAAVVLDIGAGDEDHMGNAAPLPPEADGSTTGGLRRNA